MPLASDFVDAAAGIMTNKMKPDYPSRAQKSQSGQLFYAEEGRKDAGLSAIAERRAAYGARDSSEPNCLYENAGTSC